MGDTAQSGSASRRPRLVASGRRGFLAGTAGLSQRTKTTIQSPTAVERYAATNSFKASAGTSGYTS
ncbi:MAG: hypothetical protein JWM19_1526 [Actinomycetia bacterium]|nr:hypothetical protein [Actinomycetes bacterium]